MKTSALATRLGATILFLVCALGFASRSAPAYAADGSTNGNSTCPHGYNKYTWASDLCYTGKAAYAINATQSGTYYLASPGGAGYVGNLIRNKTTMYSGSPCSAYVEGGFTSVNIAYGDNYTGYYVETRDQINGVNQAPVDYYLSRIIVVGSGIKVLVEWFTGTTTFGVGFGSGSVVQYQLHVGGGCYEEAGAFTATNEADSMGTHSFPLVQLYGESRSIEVYLVGGGGVTSFGGSDYVIDNACPGYPPDNCMNGAFVGSNGWNGVTGND